MLFSSLLFYSVEVQVHKLHTEKLYTRKRYILIHCYWNLWAFTLPLWAYVLVGFCPMGFCPDTTKCELTLPLLT